MAPSTQKALVLPNSSGEFVLDTIDVPRPGSGEVLVKIRAVAANPLDWKSKKFSMGIEKYPVVIGADIAGDIEEVGEGVANVSVGDRVLLQSTRWYRRGGSGYQQYGVFRADGVAKFPANISYDEASTMAVCLVTAFVGLFNKQPNGLGIANPLIVGRNKAAGEFIFIVGGASSVGQYAIQSARLAGFTVITTASLKHADYLKTLGAAHVVDRHLATKALTSEITKILDGRPLKHAMDAVANAEAGQVAYDLLSPDGQLLLVGRDLIQNKVEGKKILNVYGWASSEENRESVVALYSQLTTLLEEGAIKPNRVEVIPNGLAGIPKALERLENNGVSGVKLVARPQETP